MRKLLDLASTECGQNQKIFTRWNSLRTYHHRQEKKVSLSEVLNTVKNVIEKAIHKLNDWTNDVVEQRVVEF